MPITPPNATMTSKISLVSIKPATTNVEELRNSTKIKDPVRTFTSGFNFKQPPRRFQLIDKKNRISIAFVATSFEYDITRRTSNPRVVAAHDLLQHVE